MKRLSVLIADDEIPYDDEERNRQTKNVLLKNISGATDADYAKGRDGMKRAYDVLCEAAMDLEVARTVKDATEAIRRKQFDVAIIDLGWMGDQDADKRETAGWEILEELRQTEQGGHATPVIMYSNRFDSNVTLAQTAAERGTLPLPKTYTPGSHQTLVAAVRFLARSDPSPTKQFFDQALQAWKERDAELTSTLRLCRILLWVVVPVIIAGATILLLGKTDAAAFQLVASIVIGMLLGFASKQVDLAAKRSHKAMQEVSEHLQRPRQQETPVA